MISIAIQIIALFLFIITSPKMVSCLINKVDIDLDILRVWSISGTLFIALKFLI